MLNDANAKRRRKNQLKNSNSPLIKRSIIFNEISEVSNINKFMISNPPVSIRRNERTKNVGPREDRKRPRG